MKNRTDPLLQAAQNILPPGIVRRVKRKHQADNMEPAGQEHMPEEHRWVTQPHSSLKKFFINLCQ